MIKAVKEEHDFMVTSGFLSGSGRLQRSLGAAGHGRDHSPASVLRTRDRTGSVALIQRT